MVLPVMSPLGLLQSVMALAIGLVDRLMSVSVRRWRETRFVGWRETTSVVRWTAPTFLLPIAPAAAASLASLSISAPAAFGAALFGAAAVAGRVGGHVGRVTAAAVAGFAVVAAAVPGCALGRVTVAAAAAVAVTVPSLAFGSLGCLIIALAVPVSFILAGVRPRLLRRRKRGTWTWREDRLFPSALL